MAISEKIWDGRGDRMIDARYTQFPGQAADDLRLTGVHLRILTHVGRQNQRRGWLRLSQTELAVAWGLSRQRVNMGVADLVTWGYLKKQDQAQTRESFCLYKVADGDDVPPLAASDAVSVASGECHVQATPPPVDGCHVQATPVTPIGDTSVTLMDTKKEPHSPSIAVLTPPTPLAGGVSVGKNRSKKTGEADAIVDSLHTAGCSARSIELLFEPLARRRTIMAPDPAFALRQLAQWIDRSPEKFPDEALIEARDALLVDRKVAVRDADISEALKAAAAAAAERAAIAKRSLPATLAALPAETEIIRAAMLTKVGRAEFDAWLSDLMVDRFVTGAAGTVRLEVSVGHKHRAKWIERSHLVMLIDAGRTINPAVEMVDVRVHSLNQSAAA